DNVSNGLDRMNNPCRYVAAFVFRFDATQRTPCADIVPAEISSEYAHSSAAFEHANVDGYWSHSLEVTLRHCCRVQGDGNFRRNRSNLRQEISNSPHEDSRVP